jgi:hypothetical protein
MVTVTVPPAWRPEIVKENKPAGNVNPAGGAGETLDTAVAVKLVNPPRSLLNEAVPETWLPEAVDT